MHRPAARSVSVARHAPPPARWRAAAIGSLAGLLAIACGGNGGEGQRSEEQETRQATPAAVQELVVGYGGDPWVDASEMDQKRRPNYPLNADVCETLVQLTPDFQVAPSLASDWELVGDNTFRFTLKDEPRFSDGTPLSAEAVKYTLDYTVAEPATGGLSFLGPESTKVIDERTVEVTPTRPNRRLVEQINHPTYAVLAPGSDPLNEPEPICSGPFEVTEYVPNEQLVVERNDDYWGEPAKLDKITFRFIPDDTTRTLALQNGEVDLITDVPRGVLSSVEGLPGIKIQNAPVGQVFLMYTARRDLAGTDKPLADPRVRRAVAAAMDQTSFVEGVLDGNAEQVSTVAPPEVLGEYADVVEGVPFDRAESARLLDEAGWKLGPDGVRQKDGRPLELSIVFPSGSGGGTGINLTEVEFVQAQLAEVGITGKIEQLDAGAYRERLDTGNYDLDFSGPNQNDANPAFLLSLRWYSKATGKNAKFISPGPDTEFERIVEESQQATDDEELQRLAAEAMHELVDNEVGGIPLAGVYRTYAMKETVQGLEPHPSSTNQRWSTVFISE
ncbi:MAG: ABC transporter substrate-binding protein [Actinomycetota bacterium]|nr:ABC transporter substrate-binding protein [Actinomycetota bacterium]